MSGWNVWARGKADCARAKIWPWISESLREARGIGECDPARKLYPPPKVIRRSFRAATLAQTQSRLAERTARVGGNAPQPPIFGSGGASSALGIVHGEAQVTPAVEVAASGSGAGVSKMHHDDASDSPGGASNGGRDDAGRWPPATGGKRPRLTGDEIARVLTYVECGYSLRQAAAAVGRNHVSVLRHIQRSPPLAAELRQRRALARERPLRHLLEASQKSWRAAAWVVTYLDKLQPRRRKKKSSKAARAQRCQDPDNA